MPDFWKTWNAKFRNKVTRHVNINGCCKYIDVANEFAKHFEKVFYNSHEDNTSYNKYLNKRTEMNNDMQSSYECLDKITVELIDKCAKELKKGKACGPDDLRTENLHYAHPALIMHLKRLFRFIICHGVVPNNFGLGIAVPLINDKSGNFNDMDNYRAITLSPVISKLFENVILHICDDALSNDPLQFGFKRNTGTTNAIFTM